MNHFYRHRRNLKIHIKRQVVKDLWLYINNLSTDGFTGDKIMKIQDQLVHQDSALVTINEQLIIPN